ncbi:hypothetical protein M885DRAFT_560907 [Pelagophyceae sp. CCMP2097]|nr:hypothetical protein M885DRAFT_560907 [Pelagophyceae sp. CCMP2097]
MDYTPRSLRGSETTDAGRRRAGSETTDAGPADAAAAVCPTRRRISRWRVSIVLALVLSSWLCIACVIGIVQQEKDDRKTLHDQKADCRYPLNLALL